MRLQCKLQASQSSWYALYYTVCCTTDCASRVADLHQTYNYPDQYLYAPTSFLAAFHSIALVHRLAAPQSDQPRARLPSTIFVCEA